MKVSTKSRYGVAAMLDIAQHCNDGPVALRNVAERQQVSEHYLEQLMSSLRNAGYVRSIRGAQGGYVLAKDPATITVGDIVWPWKGRLRRWIVFWRRKAPRIPIAGKVNNASAEISG